jgi:hypothetical protein
MLLKTGMLPLLTHDVYENKGVILQFESCHNRNTAVKPERASLATPV